MRDLTPSIEGEVGLLRQYGLTPNEMMLVRLLLLTQDEDRSALLAEYLDILRSCGVSNRDTLLSLQAKGTIPKAYKIPKEGEAFDPHAIPVNRNFVRNLYRASFEMGKELFDTYPQFCLIDGRMVGLRSVSRKFNSLEDAFMHYGKNIRWNAKTHDEIISLVRWADERNIINYTLASFIVDMRHIELKALRDGAAGNVNLDFMHMV